LRGRLLDSETPPLSRSELVGRRGLRTPLDGRLCPNAFLTDDTRYDDAAGSGFVLVAAVPLTPEQRALLAERGTEVVEVAPDSPLGTWLARGRATAALVRPDLTVMRAGRDVASLCAQAPSFRAAAAARAVPPHSA
jgi:3-(3-hydroxy-phenyl)propionate hydroxylase